MNKMWSRNKGIYNYQLLNKYEAGIVLNPIEVRSLRNTSPSISGSYCYFNNKKELFLRGIKISSVDRDRKLLLHRRELNRIFGNMTKDKKIVIIPTELFEKNGIFKVNIALATYIRKIDRREKLKEKDERRLNN